MSGFWDVERFADNTVAIDSDGKWLSYSGLAANADAMASHWSRKKSLIFISCSNSLATLTAYLAALRHDHVAMLLPQSISQEQLESLVEVYAPDYYVASDGRCKEMGGGDNAVDEQATLLLSTSGSTGTAKQVCLSRGNLQSNAESITQYLGLSAAERPITTLPFHYSYGLSVINSHLQVGATLLLTNDAVVTSSFWDFFRENRATSFAGVPTTYEILRRLRLESMELPSLRLMTQAGGKLQRELVQHFSTLSRSKGWHFYVMYGQTEATARIAYLPPDLIDDNPDCIGQVIPGGELWLENDEGERIETTGQEGELVYRGANTMLGYVGSRQDMRRLTPPDVLRTGDLAMRKENGLYCITGRLKRIIKLYGHRIALDEMERVFHHAGYRVICGGSDQKLVIGYLPEHDPLTIQAFTNEHFHIPPAAVHCVEFESWPLTESGKIDYQQLAGVA